MRGTIIKAPDSTPGLLYVQGQQKSFTLEGIWRSPVAPAPNMIVDVDLDAAGNITALTAVTADQPAQSAAHTGQAGAAAAEQGKQAMKAAKKGIGVMAAKMGSLALGAAVLIVIAFFFFPALAVGAMGITALSYTFWNVAGMEAGMGGPSSSMGFWSLIGFVAVFAPFAVPFLKMAWAKYLNAAPLAFVLLTLIKVWWSYHSALSNAGMVGAGTPGFFDFFSLAWGFYILLLASLALASQAFMKPKTA
jgi:hypothetical protein